MERHDENAVHNSRGNTVQNNIVNAALLPNLPNMLVALAFPKPINTIAYDDELLALLEGHLSPKKNVLVAQHQFAIQVPKRRSIRFRICSNIKSRYK